MYEKWGCFKKSKARYKKYFSKYLEILKKIKIIFLIKLRNNCQTKCHSRFTQVCDRWSKT